MSKYKETEKDRILREFISLWKDSGHPEFYRLLIRMAELHNRKNKQYATLTDPLGNFKRCGELAKKLIKVDNKALAMALFYMSKQVDAVYEMVGENKKDTVEELEDKLLDIAVYSLISIVLNKDGKSNE